MERMGEERYGKRGRKIKEEGTETTKKREEESEKHIQRAKWKI